MLDISLRFECPMNDMWWKNLYNKSWKVSRYKAIEVQLMRDTELLGFCINLRTKGDHPGFRFSLGLLFLKFDFQFYDSRHWDYENNCYEIYK